jgi:hypothetical protein
MAASVLGRPGRIRVERCAQRRRSHWRCHRSTVSGCTTIKAVRHSCHAVASRTQKSRSVGRRCGRVRVRFKAASCWRRAKFSRATARCPRQISPMDRRRTTIVVSMPDPVVHSTTESIGGIGDQVLAKDRLRCGRPPNPATVTLAGIVDVADVGLTATLAALRSFPRLASTHPKLPSTGCRVLALCRPSTLLVSPRQSAKGNSDLSDLSQRRKFGLTGRSGR